MYVRSSDAIGSTVYIRHTPYGIHRTHRTFMCVMQTDAKCEADKKILPQFAIFGINMYLICTSSIPHLITLTQLHEQIRQ